MSCVCCLLARTWRSVAGRFSLIGTTAITKAPATVFDQDA